MDVVAPILSSYQREIIYSPARFTITEASTKSGKTFSHIIWLFSKAQESKDQKRQNFWWVAPVYVQAKIAFSRLRQNIAHTRRYHFHESGLIIYCPNGAEMHFKSADKPDNLFGEDVYAAVFDEAPRAREEAWFALRTTLTATGGQCKLIGNFGGMSNWVHKLKEKAKSDPNYEYFKITCWDAIREGIMNESEVLQAKKDLPAKIFRELYEAEASEDEGQLITNAAIAQMFRNDQVPEGVGYITADIARLGKDRTVIFVWSGLRVEKIVELEQTAIDQTVNVIRALMMKHNIGANRVIVDESGLGGGVRDYLRCIGFVGGAKPIQTSIMPDNFGNLKNQCYYKLAEYINRQEIYVRCTEMQERYLTEELEMVRLSKEIDFGKITLIGKDEIKSKIGRSPDYADTLKMRMWFELSNIKRTVSISV
ncbi:MAG TPA: terminase family protein, partial [Bacteroidales bacterium]|nr:terminase family protein [Bacteroidales bacterium]